MDQPIYLRINMQNSTNGHYELFSPVPVMPTLSLESISVSNPNPFQGILSSTASSTTDLDSNETKETETKEAKKKETKLFQDLSREIEDFLQENTKMYYLTKYTYFEIDGIQADIYISKHSDGGYYYRIISKNMEYEYRIVEDEEDVDFILYEKEDLDTLTDLFTHIKKVERTYKFLDFYLLSPEKLEKAKLHRAFLPLPPDKICSVCYEPTLEYTTCYHAICLKCREKCITKKNKYCPLCRKNELKYYPYELSGY